MFQVNQTTIKNKVVTWSRDLILIFSLPVLGADYDRREFEICNGRFERGPCQVSIPIGGCPAHGLRVTELTSDGVRPIASAIDDSGPRPLLVCSLPGNTPAYGVRMLIATPGHAVAPASSDLVCSEDSERIVVGTKWFRLFHPKRGGGGLPREVLFCCSGYVDRELSLLDRVYRNGDGCYAVGDDEGSTARVVFQSPLRVVVESHFVFRSGERRAPDGLGGVYRFVYSAGSPVVEVTREIIRDCTLPAVKWDELHFLQLGRKSRYYTEFFTGPGNRVRAVDPKGGEGGSCAGRQWGIMSSGHEAAGVGGGWTDCWDAAREYVYNVQRNMLVLPVDKDVCFQHGLLYFGPSDQSEAWLENWLGERREMRVVSRRYRDESRSVSPPVAQDRTIVIRGWENAGLFFGPASSGFPVIGIDSPGKRRFFGGEGTRGLWRMVFSDGVGGRRYYVTARDQGKASCIRTGTAMRFSWQGMAIGEEKGVLDVVCDVRWVADRGQYEFRMDFTNRSPTKGLVSAAYPLLRGAVPEATGTAYLPGGNWGLRRIKERSFSVDAVYPSTDVPMQFMAFEDGDEVAYLAAHDPVACEKVFHATAYDEVSIETLAADGGLPGRGVLPDFPVVLAVSRGSWRQAAGRYRRWATEKSRWTRKGAIRLREDYPRRLIDNAFWLRFEGDPIKVESEVALAEKAIAGRVPFGFHWYCWHRIPFDNSYPEYFPAKDGFAGAVERMASRGILVMPYINARLWDSGIGSFAGKASGFCAKDEHGRRRIENYGSGRELCAMCPATSFWQNEIRTIAERLFNEAGVNALYLDQVASARPARCFDGSHGHPLGGGSHWVDGYRSMLKPVHDLASAKGAALTSENTAEAYMDNIDAFLTWSPNREDDVPALPAVYSGYTMYFGCHESAGDDIAAFRALHVRNFLWGCQLGWNAKWMLDEAHRQHLECAVRLASCRRAALGFFAEGELAGEVTGDEPSPSFTVSWRDDGGVHDVTMPSVQATLWENPAGERLLAVANLSGTTRSFKKTIGGGRRLSFHLNPGEVRLERLGCKTKIND